MLFSLLQYLFLKLRIVSASSPLALLDECARQECGVEEMSVQDLVFLAVRFVEIIFLNSTAHLILDVDKMNTLTY